MLAIDPTLGAVDEDGSLVEVDDVPGQIAEFAGSQPVTLGNQDGRGIPVTIGSACGRPPAAARPLWAPGVPGRGRPHFRGGVG